MIARGLAQWLQLAVAGALLVAPTDPKDHARIFRLDPVHDAPLGVPATAVFSQNDPKTTHARARAPAKARKAGMVDLGLVGHINLAFGYGPWDYSCAMLCWGALLSARQINRRLPC